MEQVQAIDALSALANETRLAVFRILVAEGPEGVPALEIGRRIDVKPSTLSGHLSVLRYAGLVSATRHQREIRYAARVGSMRDLVVYLLEDCCGAGPGACAGMELIPGAVEPAEAEH